ncbi:MAG: radical SAM protein [Nanoarchaeota archaeon]
MTEISVDNHKLMYHPERVSEWKTEGDCYPIYMEVGPTNKCNHDCVYCALDWVKNGIENIDKSILINSLEEMASVGVKSIMFAGEGEPLLHKNIGDFVQASKSYGIDTSITTNGIPLTQDKIERILPYLSWIRFSIDSGSPENYALVHGTNINDFDKLMTNIQNAVDYKRAHSLSLTIGTQFLMIPQNVEEAVKLASRLKQIGVDNLQIKPYSHHPKSSINLAVKYIGYKDLESQLSEFNSEDFNVFFRSATAKRICEGANYNQCYGISFIALLDSKGNVLPCNIFYGNNDMTYGNIYKESFKSIWNSEKRKQVLSKLHDEGITNCRNGCRLDVINHYLHRLKNPESHDNFI